MVRSLLARRDTTGFWAGADKRLPRRSQSNWSVRAPLARWLSEHGSQAAGCRVLDVGCGDKPYLPFFESASEYVGFDLSPNRYADLNGSLDLLPVEDESFDVVLCIQVLEHVADPLKAVKELRRVTRSGGLVLLSTHGTQVYHPNPEDYWRWTRPGLELLFEGSGPWKSVEITPGAGTAACLGMLTATYLEIALKRMHVSPVARPLVGMLNRAAWMIDARSSSLREPVSGSLIANYHVVAAR